MTAKDQSKTDSKTDPKALKKTGKIESTTSKRKSSVKALASLSAQTRMFKEPTQSSATTAAPNITTKPTVKSNKDRSTTASAAADADKQVIQPGIDALTIMKQAEAERRAAKPEQHKPTEHVPGFRVLSAASRLVVV